MTDVLNITLASLIPMMAMVILSFCLMVHESRNAITALEIGVGVSIWEYCVLALVPFPDPNLSYVMIALLIAYVFSLTGLIGMHLKWPASLEVENDNCCQ